MGKKKTPRRAPARPPQVRSAAPAPARWQAGAAAVTLAVVGGYAFVSGVFTLPPTPAHAAVEEVFAPYFSQKWDVFAPDIVRTNSALEIQAQWRDADGDLVHSGWVGATAAELGDVRGSLFPSRVSKNTVNAAGAYISRYEELSPDQQDRVRDTFIEVDGEGGFRPIPDRELVSSIEELAADDGGEAVRLIRYDYMLTRFADAYAEAHFGREVERVRWRVRFDRPNDFEERSLARQKRPSYLTFGWRQPSGDTSEDVAAVFTEREERYGL